MEMSKMKRVIACIAVLVMMISLFVPVMAAEFTPSVTNKPAPEIVPLPDPNGKPAIGVLKENGKIIGYVYEDCLVVTPVSEAKDSKDIPEDAKKLLLEVYEKLKNGEMKLPYEKYDPSMNPGNMVIRDLFDASFLCGDHPKDLAKKGVSLDLTFKLNVPAGVEVVAMTYINGKWVPVVKTVNNGDGTVTCTLEDICPISFSIRTGITPPQQTGDASFLHWMVIALVALAAIVTLTVIYNVNNKKRAAN